MPVRFRYAGSLQQLSKARIFRILALAMGLVLVRTTFVPANCTAFAAHASGATVVGSSGSQGDSDNDAGCCSYCFCCHFAGVVSSADPNLTFLAIDFLEADRNPAPPSLSLNPSDQPPRL